MHLELVELLRCPVAHAPSVLVAAADTITNRYVTAGLLGCPECHAEYPISGGVTQFINREPGEASGALAPDPLRLAAQLSLSAGRTVFALIGFDVSTMIAMREMVAARMLLFNPPHADFTPLFADRLKAASSVGPLGVAIFDSVLPLLPAKFDGFAINIAHMSPNLLEQATTTLRTGGRLVASVNAAVPLGMRELVRDEQVWVAEREPTASAPVGISRR